MDDPRGRCYNTGMKTTRRKLVSILGIILGACGGGKAPSPFLDPPPVRALWISPTHVDPDGTVHAGLREGLKDLFRHPEQWTEACAATKVFKFYAGNAMADAGFFIDEALPFLRTHGIGVALEVGGATGTQCGPGREQLFQDELAFVQRIYDEGYEVEALCMDSPLGFGAPWCPYDFDAGVENVARYVATYRARFPGVLIGLTDPLPLRFRGTYRPDFPTAIRTVVERLARDGLALDFLQADNPLEHGQWGKVVEAERACRDLGLDFGLISNSESPSDQGFCDGSMEAYRQYGGAGGTPDFVVLQSWFPRPLADAPEDGTATFTRLVRDFARRFQ